MLSWKFWVNVKESFNKVWHKEIIFKLRKYCILGKLMNLFVVLLKGRWNQEVILNEKFFFWSDFNVGAPMKPVRHLLLFLTRINDLLERLSSKAKLFLVKRKTFLFSTVYDNNIYTNELISDLARVNKWVLQMKIIFNPAPNKQTQEIKFGRKKNSYYLH